MENQLEKKGKKNSLPVNNLDHCQTMRLDRNRVSEQPKNGVVEGMAASKQTSREDCITK